MNAVQYIAFRDELEKISGTKQQKKTRRRLLIGAGVGGTALLGLGAGRRLQRVLAKRRAASIMARPGPAMAEAIDPVMAKAMDMEIAKHADEFLRYQIGIETAKRGLPRHMRDVILTETDNFDMAWARRTAPVLKLSPDHLSIYHKNIKGDPMPVAKALFGKHGVKGQDQLAQKIQAGAKQHAKKLFDTWDHAKDIDGMTAAFSAARGASMRWREGLGRRMLIPKGRWD
jgi:hypothetical protein